MFAAKNTTTAPSPSSITNKGVNTFIQPKLDIGRPGDKYEVEADKAADQIVAKNNESSAPFFPAKPVIQKQSEEDVQKQDSQETEIQQQPVVDPITPGVQLKETNTVQKAEEEEVQLQEESDQGEGELQMMAVEESVQQMPEDTLQTKESSEITPPLPSIQKMTSEDVQRMEDEEVQEKEEEEVQTLQKQTTGDDGSTSSVENNLNTSRGGGSPLDSNTKGEMESGFGADFSGVRVHNDSNAVQMNQQLGAQAFTSGNDIYFNEGKYSPESDSGKHLLAHELTHTVQQGASDTKSVQKTEDAAPTPTRPTAPIDISQRLDLNDEWATYLDNAYSEGERTFDLDVKIGESYRGVIKVNKKRGTAEGETAKYDLARGNDRYLEISGWSFLNPLRQAGVTPILVLREFGDGQQTTGFLSVKMEDVALVADVQGFIRGLNENLETMSFLGIEPLNVDGLENTFENGRLVFQVSALTTVVDGFLEAGGGLGITGETFTFNLNANVDVAGLATGEFTIARGEDGSLSGSGEIQADIANVQATIRVEYIEGLVTIQGTGRMNSEKFSGEITLLVTDEARSTQMMHAALGVESMDAAAEDAGSPAASAPKTRTNQVLAGWGEIQATITPWLEGTAKVGIDNEGHVTVVGEILVPDEIELMEQRGKKVDLFNIEIRAGYGIPLVGQVFLFASVGMFVNAGFGPLVLKDIGFTGTYSTDPNVLQQFSITGTLGINAFAVIGLEAEAGVGVTILGHDVKAGVNVTAAAGIRAYAEATPTFEYSESQAPEGGKVGESHLRGHFEAAAQLFLQLTGALFYELDSPWWSPAPDGREEYPLGEVQYPIGDSMGIGADIDWLVGSPDAPELTFSPVEFDPDKFTADVMADPPPRTMGDADAEPEGAWTGEPGSEQNENPEITGDGEGLPPNSRREEDLSNLPDEQKYMRALDEMSRLETASPRPTLSVVEAEARKVKRKYGVAKVETRDEQDDQVSVYVEHARENNGRHLLNIPLMSTAERVRLLNAAMEALQTGSRNAADEEGKITRADAEQVLTTLQRNHPVITEARVVEGENTWDYFIDIGDREETEGGNLKKESETEEITDDNNLEDLSQIVIPFTETDGDNHTLKFAVEGNNVDLMVHSNPKDIFEYLNSDEVDQADPVVNDARRLASEIRTMANNAADTDGLVPNLNSKMRELSEMMAHIRPDLRGYLPANPVYNYTPQNNMAHIAEADLLSANRSGGTPPGGAYVAGWQAIQQGLTTGGGHWKRLHLINQGFGGFGVPENLTPGTQSDNSEYEKFDGPVKERIGSRPNDSSAQGVVKIKATITSYYAGEFPANQQAPKVGRGIDQFASDGRVTKDNYAENIKFEAWEYSYNKGANSWTLADKFVDDNLGIELPDWNLVSPSTVGVATKSEYTGAYDNLSDDAKDDVDSTTSDLGSLFTQTTLNIIKANKPYSDSGIFRTAMDNEIAGNGPEGINRIEATKSKLRKLKIIIPVMVTDGVLKY